jgi:hypothetical protein
MTCRSWRKQLLWRCADLCFARGTTYESDRNGARRLDPYPSVLHSSPAASVNILTCLAYSGSPCWKYPPSDTTINSCNTTAINRLLQIIRDGWILIDKLMRLFPINKLQHRAEIVKRVSLTLSFSSRPWNGTEWQQCIAISWSWFVSAAKPHIEHSCTPQSRPSRVIHAMSCLWSQGGKCRQASLYDISFRRH